MGDALDRGLASVSAGSSSWGASAWSTPWPLPAVCRPFRGSQRRVSTRVSYRSALRKKSFWDLNSFGP